MHSTDIKRKVKLMRTNGRSIQDISIAFNLSKSTISYWCRDIELSKQMIEKIKNNGKHKLNKALLLYSEKIRKERKQRTKDNKKKGAELVSKLSVRDILMIGLGLYWGEGYKESNGELGFTNSNIKVIKFYIKWLKLFNVNKNDLIFRLTINKIFEEEEQNIKLFWITSLGINNEQFSKTTLINSNLKKFDINKKLDYKGILRVKVRKGLNLKNKILGAIEYISTCI